MNVGLFNKYGYLNIAIFGAIFVLAYIFGVWVGFFGLLFLVVLFVYFNPERVPESDDKMAILSPIDGKILDVKKSTYLGDEYLEVVIQNSLLRNGVLRSVANVDISEINAKNGLNLISQNNMKNLLSSKVAYICKILGKKIVVKICSGAISRKIHHEKAKKLKAGERFGFIVDGRVSLFLPTNTSIKVLKDDVVKSCEIIGFLNGK